MLDHAVQRVRVFNADGLLLETIPRDTTALRGAQSITLVGDTLFIAEYGRSRISAWTLDGRRLDPLVEIPTTTLSSILGLKLFPAARLAWGDVLSGYSVNGPALADAPIDVPVVMWRSGHVSTPDTILGLAIRHRFLVARDPNRLLHDAFVVPQPLVSSSLVGVSPDGRSAAVVGPRPSSADSIDVNLWRGPGDPTIFSLEFGGLPLGREDRAALADWILMPFSEATSMPYERRELVRTWVSRALFVPGQLKHPQGVFVDAGLVWLKRPSLPWDGESWVGYDPDGTNVMTFAVPPGLRLAGVERNVAFIARATLTMDGPVCVAKIERINACSEELRLFPEWER